MDFLAHPTFLAPMEGVTHPAFREIIARRGGVGMLCTEFVRIGRSDLNPETLKRAVIKVPGVPLSVQVMGNDEDKMAEAAAVVADAGADVIDINLGCPMPRVVRKGVGAAMLKDPVLLDRVVSAMRRRTPGLLSAKIRAGFDDADNVVQIARVVEAAGVDYLAVHPRRRCDFYQSTADWRIVRTLKEALSIPVVGNGDVWYAASALAMERETGCDAVMIGRPALRNPWIFEQIALLRAGAVPLSPSGADVARFVRHVGDTYASLYRNPLGKLKELTTYLVRAVPGGRSDLRHLLRSETLGQLCDGVDAAFGSLGAGDLDLDAHGTLRLERTGEGFSGDSTDGSFPTVSALGPPIAVKHPSVVNGSPSSGVSPTVAPSGSVV
ncbi:MAG: tRNA-dihydrouridine synthase [Myxococcales bacterium]|nr:tRNA-dihydrouridine synthase [Myxococcales bacterium]